MENSAIRLWYRHVIAIMQQDFSRSQSWSKHSILCLDSDEGANDKSRTLLIILIEK